MADAIAGLEAAGWRPVVPAYRWCAAQDRGEQWVVRFPAQGPGEGVCRAETKEMAETVAGMLNEAFSLGAHDDYRAKWDELRNRVSAELDDAEMGEAEMSSECGPGNYDTLEMVLGFMDEAERRPASHPQGPVLAQLIYPAEPATHPGGPGPPRQPKGPGLRGNPPARENEPHAEIEAGS
jgi:hypothetical protein